MEWFRLMHKFRRCLAMTEKAVSDVQSAYGLYWISYSSPENSPISMKGTIARGFTGSEQQSLPRIS